MVRCATLHLKFWNRNPMTSRLIVGHSVSSCTCYLVDTCLSIVKTTKRLDKKRFCKKFRSSTPSGTACPSRARISLVNCLLRTLSTESRSRMSWITSGLRARTRKSESCAGRVEILTIRSCNLWHILMSTLRKLEKIVLVRRKRVDSWLVVLLVRSVQAQIALWTRWRQRLVRVRVACLERVSLPWMRHNQRLGQNPNE